MRGHAELVDDRIKIFSFHPISIDIFILQNLKINIHTPRRNYEMPIEWTELQQPTKRHMFKNVLTILDSRVKIIGKTYRAI